MIVFRVSIKPVSLASIGSNYPVALGPDISFARKPTMMQNGNINYDLYVPGSSLKGALRSSASRVSLAYGFSSCSEVRPELIEMVHEQQGTCDVCKLFGEPKSAIPSPLFASDLKPTNNIDTFPVTRIRLDDATLHVAQGALFRIERCPPGKEFRGTIRLNVGANVKLIGLLLLSFAELRLGRIGRETLVDVRLEETDGLRRPLEERWFSLLDELSRWVWS